MMSLNSRPLSLVKVIKDLLKAKNDWWVGGVLSLMQIKRLKENCK